MKRSWQQIWEQLEEGLEDEYYQNILYACVKSSNNLNTVFENLYEIMSKNDLHQDRITRIRFTFLTETTRKLVGMWQGMEHSGCQTLNCRQFWPVKGENKKV